MYMWLFPAITWASKWALLLFSEAQSKSYAVVPMMLFSLKHLRAPILGILFKFLLPPCSEPLFLCTREKGSKWYFKSQILTGKLFWERWLAPMVDALWTLEMWWARWQLPELHVAASLSHLPRWLTNNCGLLTHGGNWPPLAGCFHVSKITITWRLPEAQASSLPLELKPTQVLSNSQEKHWPLFIIFQVYYVWQTASDTKRERDARERGKMMHKRLELFFLWLI